MIVLGKVGGVFCLYTAVSFNKSDYVAKTQEIYATEITQSEENEV